MAIKHTHICDRCGAEDAGTGAGNDYFTVSIGVDASVREKQYWCRKCLLLMGLLRGTRAMKDGEKVATPDPPPSFEAVLADFIRHIVSD